MSGLPLPWDEARFRRTVADARSRGEPLIELLQEAHPAFAGCSSQEVARRRGWIFVQLAKAPLQAGALPFLLEALQTGHEPYLLAATAHALRQAPIPDPRFGPCLLRAIDYLSQRDDFMDLACWGGVTEDDSGPTALNEVLQTLQWLAPHAEFDPETLLRLSQAPGIPEDLRRPLQDMLAYPGKERSNARDCCSPQLRWGRLPWNAAKAAQTALARFEDQDGVGRTWDEVFVGQVCLVGFFYTRCENPLKCSLTISKLSQVQQLLTEAGLDEQVRIAAISYDGDFDLPHRLRGYAHARGLQVNDHCHVLRTTQAPEEVRRFFDSGVNFVGRLVNWHRIELFILDAAGRPALTYQRLEWQPRDVLEDLREVLTARREPANLSKAPDVPAAIGTTPALLALFLALLPKCPICGATYLSLAGITALPYLEGWSRLWPMALALLLGNVSLLAWMARRSRRWMPVLVAATGAMIIAGPGLAWGSELGMLLGLAVSTAGSLLSVISKPASASTRAAGISASRDATFPIHARRTP